MNIVKVSLRCAITILLFSVASLAAAAEQEFNVTRTEAEWKELLTPAQYNILREKGTERAFSGKYYDYKEKGFYHCAGCGQILFSSEHKYDSKTGWPSFWQPAREGVILEKEDKGWFTVRTEVICSNCGSHLGHVFKDGPPPTGLRYCINSLALVFREE